MADEKPSLQVDTDWKKQAQEEKRRQMEKERQAATTQGGAAASGPAGGGAPGAAAGRQRQLPPASFASLVQTLMTQALYYLGDLAAQGQQGGVNLDMAKHQVDTLAVLEEKTRNNLSDEEKRLIDMALYEVRMRYVSVAQQFLGP